MAQYSKGRKAFFHGGNDDIYEVVMLSDQFGNLIGPANPSGVAVDAFGRARMSSPYTLFDSSNVIQKNDKFDESITGSGSNVVYSYDESTVELILSTDANSSVIRQSKRNFSYQPGKSLLILNTYVFAPPQAGLTQRVGYFNDNDGIFLEYSGGQLYIVLRSSTTGGPEEIRVPSTSWNSDKLDSEGTSHISLNPTASQIFWIDLEWLGVGTVRTGFVIDGKFVVAHSFHNANIHNKVYMRTPNLPIRYEISNSTELTSYPTMKQVCSSVISEGGYEARALQHVYGTALAGNGTITANTFMNLVTIRMENYPSYDIDSIVVPSGVDILNVANTDFEWGLFLNATATGLNYNTATTRVQYAIDGVNLTSTGRRIAGGYMGGKTAPFSLGDGGFDWDYQLGRTIAGVSDTLTLAVRATSTSKNAAGMIKWYEL